MLPPLINKLMQHNNLSAEECLSAIEIMSQQLIPEQAAAFLTLLHAKGETLEELQGFITGFKKVMLPVTLKQDCLDVVGTGGDGYNTVNISTITSLVTASLGIPTAKHGNRSVSSRCGSADFIESLAIRLEDTALSAEQSLLDTHYAFLYAPAFHPGLKKFKKFRETLGVRTSFNLIGPLLNPARPNYYLVGVYAPHLLPIFAKILAENGVQRALVVHSQGLDEVTLLGTTEVYEVNEGKIQYYRLDPRDYGFKYCQLSDIQGGNSDLNRALILNALDTPSNPIQDTIIINAGLALYAAKRAETLAESIELCRQHIRARKVLPYIQSLQHYHQKKEQTHA